MAEDGRLRIGSDLVVDTQRGRVSRGDHEINLPRLSYELLVVLVRAGPKLLSIDELMSAVWPGLVVNPETVIQRVKLLRDALGDDPKEPRYIAGMRGRGYQLIAPVEPLPSLTTGPAEAPELGEANKPRSWVPWILVAAALALACVGVVAWLKVPRPTTPAPAKAVTVAAAPARSVAVLRFENLTAVPETTPLADGIAESVLYQLGRLDQIVVIARTSSFAFEGRHEDVRRIGRALNARYLLAGSVQREHERLRVIAQLIDAESGSQLWSMRFDRTPPDVFAMQDEIALEVARALKLTLDTGDIAKLTRHGTHNLEAYLAHLQGRALLATRRMEDLQRAKERFEEAIRLDAEFAGARVSLAEAYAVEAYFPLSELWFTDPPVLPPAVRREVDEQLERALKLDPGNGDAYLVRAWLNRDAVAAEADFRRGLKLSPNNAAGAERFARLLWYFLDDKGVLDLKRREESYKLIDVARALDPLTPTAHLTKGLMVAWGKTNVQEGNALMLQALERDPNYYPALMHLGMLRWLGQGEFAEAIRYGEQALALEPQADWPRALLAAFYGDIGDFAAATQVVAAAPHPNAINQVGPLLYRNDWRRASEIAYGPLRQLSALDVSNLLRALSVEAHETRKTRRARELLHRIGDVDWSAPGAPRIGWDAQDYGVSVAVAEVLLLDGETDQANNLLRQAVERIDSDARERGGYLWLGLTWPRALALLGEKDAALGALRKTFDEGLRVRWQQRLEWDYAFDGLRSDPRFQLLHDDMLRQVAAQRAKLEAMRNAGLVPRRAAN